MTKLIVYGDSFAAYPKFKNNKDYVSWVDLLANKLQITSILNRSINGSSIEFSIRKFTTDIVSNVIKKDDIIIFIMSKQGRFHTSYQNKCPVSAAQFVRASTFEVDHINIPEDQLLYFKNNKPFIEWYLKNRDNELIAINTSAYLHMLASFAKNNLSNTFILLTLNPIKNPIEPIFPENFIYPKIELMKISINEFISTISYSDWTKTTKQDVRYNHLSIPNINIFADLLYETIQKRNSNLFSYDKFKRNFLNKTIKSVSDYETYINSNIIYNNPAILDILNKL